MKFALPNGRGQIMIYPETLRSLLGDELDNPLQGAIYRNNMVSAKYARPITQFVNGAQDTAEGRIETSWYGHLENMICFMMNELHKKNLPVGKIIVTGGSCQLLGIKKHIFEAANAGSIPIAEENILYMDKEHDYESAVPYGGAFYIGGLLSHFDALVSFPDKLRNVLRDEIKEVAAEKIANQMFTHADTVLINAFNWWCDDRHNRGFLDESSVSDLKKRIEQEKTTYFDRARKNQILDDIEDTLKRIDFNRELPRTKRVVSDLLDHLAGKSFTGNPNLNAAKINIPDLDGLLSCAINSIEYRDLAPGFFTGDSPSEGEIMGRRRRRRARDNYKSNNWKVTGYLKEKISGLLQEGMKKTDIFGVPDEILETLCDDIVCALYMNK